jgi:transcriptional regulator with XRE-family HTH domain
MRKSESTPEIGERIKNIRMELHLQQKDVADALKISPSYLSEIENGNGNPGPEFFKRLAIAFNVNLHYIILGIGDKFFNHGDSENLPQPFEYTKGTEIETIDELVWLMRHSVFFMNTVLALSNKIINTEESAIMASLQRNKTKKSRKNNL